MKLFIDGRREGYSVDQIRCTMTVGELIAYLEDYPEDTEIYLCNDNGYTFGSITADSFSEARLVDDEWVSDLTERW